MTNQRLRNLTTGRLHTCMDDIYEDLELITNMKGIMTHMLPRACKAIRPWLKKHLTDERFWNDEYDTGHTGDTELPIMTPDEQGEMMRLYSEQPSPFYNL